MTPVQSRMARAALNWSLYDLAEAAGVSRITAARFETGSPTSQVTVLKLRQALERAGTTIVERSGQIGVTVPKS